MEQISTADLCDDHSDNLGIADPLFLSYGKKSSFYGEIVTVKIYEDNVILKETLSSNGKGKVLVADGGGSTRCALVGDLIADLAVKNEWAGIIVYGYIRDARVIETINIGIKALGTCPIKSIKKGQGDKQITVKFASTNFIPGQFVYSDEDGIIVSETAII
ncbi:MAG: ribonuclease E activity regulator RraA [Flavobacteriales bacterium]|nr:ribonuclease E activity regulator RraA [Flavobacteriales bacterium]